MRGAKWGCLALCLALMVSAIPMASSEGVGRGASATRAGDELVLRVAMQDDIKTLNPLVTSDVWTANVVNWLYDKPMGFDPDTDELIPYIANGTTNGTADNPFNYDDPGTLEASELAKSPVGKVCTVWYNLTGVKWHDDHPMDMEDLLFSFYANAALPKWNIHLGCLKDKGGSLTGNYSSTHYIFVNPVYQSGDGRCVALRFYLQSNYSSFIRETLSPLLLPCHIWSTMVSGQANDDVRPWFPKGDAKEWKPEIAESWDSKVNGIPKVVGCGPFKFVYWDRNSCVKVTTWRERPYGQQPILDAILYIIYQTTESAIQALQNDEIDYISWSIPPYYISSLSTLPDVGIAQSVERGFFYMAYNMRRKSFGYDGNGTDYGLPLRRAIAHCVDKQYIVERLLQNYGSVGVCPINPLDTDWYNNSIARYTFDLGKAKEMLLNAGYVEPDWNDPTTLGTPLNCWKNPDGTKIGSEADGKIRIIAPQYYYDPVRYQSNDMLAFNLRKIGIYAHSVSMDVGAIGNDLYANNFDMLILGWRIATEPTDYMWNFFHSNGALNYPGYHNSSYDAIIDEAKETGDIALKQSKIKDASGIIATDLPIDVLYFRSNIEAYSGGRFSGFSGAVPGVSGTLFTWRNLLRLHPPWTDRLRAFLDADLATVSEETTKIRVIVKDQNKNLVQGVKISLNVSSGSLDKLSGYTDNNGVFIANYVAPSLAMYETERYVGIQLLLAEKVRYESAPGKLRTISIYPSGGKFLRIVPKLDQGLLKPGDSTTVKVLILDQDRRPLPDADVWVNCSDGASIQPRTARTDSEGYATFTIVANQTNRSSATISITAQKDGFPPSQNYASLLLFSSSESLPTPNSNVPYDNEVLVVISVVILVAIVAALAAARRLQK